MGDFPLQFSIIIPAPVWRPDWPALEALKQNPPPGPHEIILAIGNHPAIQRNEALAIAKYGTIVFLDSDAAIAEDYWEILRQNLLDQEVKVIGGPSRLQPGFTFLESIFQGLLTHPFIVGPMAHRYRAAPFKNWASQQNLILCNLVSRAEVFKAIGNFSPALFPNEENEWMDRASFAKIRMVYQPLLQVFRPQRKTFRQFFLTMLRYGIGRTQQFRVARVFALQLILPLMLIGGVVGMVASLVYLGWRPTIVALLCGYALLAVIHGVTSLSFSEPRPTSKRAVLIGILGPFVPITYALGQLVGWFVSARGTGSVSVRLVDPENRPLMKDII